MEEKMLEIKMTLTAMITAAGTILGWKGCMGLAWVVMMALDYLSGSLAAKKRGQWESGLARQGLWHKGGMILVVLVAAITDTVLALASEGIPERSIAWPGVVLPLVLSWYILTEAGSILENAVKLGAAVPSWLTKGLKISLDALERSNQDR